MTLVTSAMVEHVAEFGTAFAGALWDSGTADGWRVAGVRAQRPVRATVGGEVRGGFVDLELLLQPANESPLGSVRTLWIEVKHGAPLSGDQIRTYLAALPPGGELVILAPRDEPVTFGGEDERDRIKVRTLLWEDVARDVASELRAHRRMEACEGVTSTGRAHWLIDEYFEFLQTEGLMDPEFISRAQIDAVNAYAAARGAIRELLAAVARLVSAEWPYRDGDFDPTPGATPKPTSRSDAAYVTHGIPTSGDFPIPGWFLEWGFAQTTDFEPPVVAAADEGYVIYAGLTWDQSDEREASDARRAAVRDWAAQQAAGSENASEQPPYTWTVKGRNTRLIRAWPAAVLFDATSDEPEPIADLAARVARRIVATFAELSVHRPPGPEAPAG